MKGKELEIKFRLPDKDFKVLSSWLAKNAKFIAEEDHEEYYFDHEKIPFAFTAEDGIKDADDYLRLRKEKTGRYSICLKKWHKHPTRKGEHTHCDEYEFEVSDGEQAKALLENLGFSDLTEIIKNRKKFIYDVFEIVIDEVKGLGRFAEVELKEDFESTDEAHEKILNLLRKVGIRKIEKQVRGYVSLIWNPGHDFGQIKEF